MTLCGRLLEMIGVYESPSREVEDRAFKLAGKRITAAAKKAYDDAEKGYMSHQSNPQRAFDKAYAEGEKKFQSIRTRPQKRLANPDKYN